MIIQRYRCEKLTGLNKDTNGLTTWYSSEISYWKTATLYVYYVIWSLAIHPGDCRCPGAQIGAWTSATAAFLLPTAEERGLLRGGFNIPLRWRHNGHGGVSNHQPHHCLLNGLVRQIKENIKAPRYWLLSPVNSPHKWPVTRKRFSFDDVIMLYVLSPALTKSRGREVCV